MNLVADMRRNPDLWLTRLYYFVYFGGGGLALPFLTLFYSRLDFSGTQIGWITAIGSVVSLVVAPVWTNRSHQWRNPRAVLQGALFAGSLCYLWLSQQHLFWGVIIVTVIRTLVMAGVSPLSDSLALSVINKVGKGFGTVRVWASAGWAVAGLFAGWLMEQTNVRSSILFASATTLAAVLILFLIDGKNFHAAPGQSRASSGIPLRTIIRGVLQDRAMVGVGLMIVVIGIMNNGVGQFETVYLDKLGASDQLIGVAVIMGAVVEIPFMLVTDRLMVRKGAYRLLLTAMLMNVALRSLVFMIPAVGTIMVERALGGISFSFYVIGMFTFISQHTTMPQTRTVMALYNVTLVSIIGMIAPPIAGAIYDLVGARWLYAIAAAGYLLGWLVLYLVTGPSVKAKRLEGETVDCKRPIPAERLSFGRSKQRP